MSFGKMLPLAMWATDEYEYVERADYPQTLKYVYEGRNVIVLRTFSKIYGLAGLRIGYGISNGITYVIPPL